MASVLDVEGRLQAVFQLRVLGQHLAALGGGGERPVDLADGALRVGEGDGVGLVLFVEEDLADLAELVLLDQILEAAAHLLELGGRFEVDAAGGVFAFLREELGEGLGDLFVAQALLDLVEEAEVLVQLAHELGELLAFDACDFSSPWRRTMPSEARLTMTCTYSRSSLMYCSNLPFLILNSGGCAM